MFPAVLRASAPVFMFYAPGQVFDGSEGVGSRFHVLCSRSRFPRYRECRVPFSCFALPDSFSAVPRASGPFFMFCASRYKKNQHTSIVQRKLIALVILINTHDNYQLMIDLSQRLDENSCSYVGGFDSFSYIVEI
jgi:hypothetical protein